MGLLGKAHWTHSESPFVSHRQRKLCKEKPSPRVPSGTSPRPGWRRLARPYGSQLFYLQPNSRTPGLKNFIRPTVSGRAPFPTQPSRRDGRAGHLPLGRPAILAALERPPLAMAEKQLNQTQPLSKCPAFSHLATNRAHWARESTPPHAARATFTSFIPLCRWRRLVFQKNSL